MHASNTNAYPSESREIWEPFRLVLGFGKDAGKYMLFIAGENTSNNYTDLMWNNLTVLEWNSGASIKLRQSRAHWSLSFFREATQAVIGKAEGVSKMRKQKNVF